MMAQQHNKLPLLLLSTVSFFAAQVVSGRDVLGAAGPDSRWCTGKEAFDEQTGSFSGLSPAFVRQVINGAGGRNLRSGSGEAPKLLTQAAFGSGGSSKRALQDTEQIGPVPQVEETWPGTTAQDLYNEYYTVFKYGNRNAASHLWSRFLLERSAQMDHERFAGLFGAFCPVSGSPVSPGDHNRYVYQLDRVDGSGRAVGFLHHCCWPCVCDTRELIKVDTATVPLAGGITRTYNFLVIGNPCSKPEELTKERVDAFSRGDGKYTLVQAAPEVRCDEAGNLINAPMSDHGYVIIGMLADFPEQTEVDAGRLPVPPLMDEPSPGRTLDFAGRKVQDEQDWDPTCVQRAEAGYNSGMGTIFRAVAQISPVAIGTSLTTPTKATEPQQAEEEKPKTDDLDSASTGAGAAEEGTAEAAPSKDAVAAGKGADKAELKSSATEEDSNNAAAATIATTSQEEQRGAASDPRKSGAAAGSVASSSNNDAAAAVDGTNSQATREREKLSSLAKAANSVKEEQRQEQQQNDEPLATAAAASALKGGLATLVLLFLALLASPLL